MNKTQVDLLKQIVDGKDMFFGGFEEPSLEHFQPIAEYLIEFGQNGLVSDVDAKREARTGKEYYDNIKVGRITEKGRTFLQQGETQLYQNKLKEDIKWWREAVDEIETITKSRESDTEKLKKISQRIFSTKLRPEF